MSEQTTILVPIRYPLTEASSRTLTAAERLAIERAPAELRVLHVNLFQNNERTKPSEILRAISSSTDEIEATVSTRRGFMVEEVILAEARAINADVVVVGENQKAAWRRFLSRIAGNTPDIGSFLRQNIGSEIEIKEVDRTADPVPV